MVTAGRVPCSHKVTACPCQITLGPVFLCMTWGCRPVCSRKSSRSYNCKILWFSGEWEEEEGRIGERERAQETSAVEAEVRGVGGLEGQSEGRGWKPNSTVLSLSCRFITTTFYLSALKVY